MIIIFLLLIPFFSQASIGSEYAYSRACVAGQCGDWQKAQQQMSNLVIDNPDSAELLYDNGVAAFRLQEFQKAGAYFEDVTKKSNASVSLKKQAHFNLGNTQVALNELPKAIEQYEAVLAIDPQDERAKYNLDKVRALLAQQQQEEKQQEKQDKQDQNKDQDSDSESEQKKSQQQEGNQDQDKQQQGNDSSEQKKQGSGKQQESSQGGDKGQKGDQSKPDSSKQKDDSASKGDEQGDEENQPDGGSAGQDQNKEQDQLSGGHDNSPERDQKEQTDDAHNVASQKDKKQESGKGQEDQEPGKALSSVDDTDLDKDRRAQDLAQTQQKFASNEQWMARLLQRQDKADERANKRLIKATVDKNMAGKYGQNNW